MDAEIVALIGISVSLTVLLLTAWHHFVEWKDKLASKLRQEGQKNVEKGKFLGVGDMLIPEENGVKSKTEILGSAKQYIKVFAVTGYFNLDVATQRCLEEKWRKKVQIKILLLDPQSPLLEYIVSQENKYTQFSKYAGAKSVESNKENIMNTMHALHKIAEIRLYDAFPFWRGMIVDGKRTRYAVCHLPREGTEPPLIINENEDSVKHFEKYYFDEIWKNAKMV